MPEPTLRDITIMGAAADPQLGTGTPAVVYDNSKLINTLNNAAQYHAENEWRKYNLFLNNIKDAYKDVNNIAQMEVMTQDREGLKKKMGEILKGISSDPRGFVSGGAKYQEIMGQIASLQSDATESKANSLYDKAHRQYFYQNPELDTEENRTNLESFPKQPLGSRRQYTFRLPGMYDAGKAAEYLNTIVKSTDQKVVGDENSPYFDEVTTTSYDPERYKTAALQMFEMKDKRGYSPREIYKERFDKMPEQIKNKYSSSVDPVKDFYLDDIMSRVLPGESKTERKTNQNYLAKEKLAEDVRHSKAVEGIGWKNAETSRMNAETARINANKISEATGVDTKMALGAVNYANNLISKIKGLADKNGIVSSSSILNLTSDEMNYMGEGSYSQGKFALISAANKLKGKSLKVNDDGTVGVGTVNEQGEFILEKTIAPKTIALNKLSEELSVSSGKESNAFNDQILQKIYGGASSTTQNTANTINISDVPAGTKLEERDGKYFYQGKEVIIQ